MDNPAVGGGRRRGATKHSAEDQALDQIAKEVKLFNYSIFSMYTADDVIFLFKV
jgi:hypothetical protein